MPDDKKWILTCQGRECHLDDLSNFSPSIEEVAHALSNLCRFTGHGPFYSVAQHSVYVAMHLPKKWRLQGLLHDATEAYLGDVSAPLKRLLPGYRRLEEKLQRSCIRTFGLEWTPEIKAAVLTQDLRALATEARTFFNVSIRKSWGIPYSPWRGDYITPVPPRYAEEVFLDYYRRGCR